MAVVTYRLYKPPGRDYTIAYRFRKGKPAGTYEVNVEGHGFIGYVGKYRGGWADSLWINPCRKTRREAAEDLIDVWIAKQVARAIDKMKMMEEKHDG